MCLTGQTGFCNSLRFKVRGNSVCAIWLRSVVRHKRFKCKRFKCKRYKTHPRTPWRRCGAGVELPWKSVWPPGRAEAAWGRWRCAYRLTYRPSGPLYPEIQTKQDRGNLRVLVCLCHCRTASVIRVVWKGQPLGRPTVTDYSFCAVRELIFPTRMYRARRKEQRQSESKLLRQPEEHNSKTRVTF